MATRATPFPGAIDAPPADVVLGLSWTSWDGAAARGRCMPEDRLAAALPGHERVRRVVVANPYRSLAARMARDPLGRRRSFPSSTRAHLHEPLRLRRRDPVAVAAIERWAARYERSLQRAAERRGLVRPGVILTHPLVAGFGSFSWAGSVTYYAWDDWRAALPLEPWWPAFDAAFERLRRDRRRVCAVSQVVLDRIAPTGPALVVPNGIEASEWERPGPPPAWFLERPCPRLVYVGSLDERVDTEQVRRVAEAHPGCSVTLVGPLLAPEHYAPLRMLRNVELHPRIERHEVVGLIAAADACLIPHARNPMTEAMSPLKLYEYLAGGRPVVATDLPPVRGVHPTVELVAPGGDAAGALARALERAPLDERSRRDFVAAHAWEGRHAAILSLALAS